MRWREAAVNRSEEPLQGDRVLRERSEPPPSLGIANRHKLAG